MAIDDCGSGSLARQRRRRGEWFVAQKNQAADDRNPGTEAKPVKTILAGVKLAQPGDTVWVKEGNYEDRVVLDRMATAARPIVLSAWKDDRVRIGYLPRALPMQGDWEPIPGSKSFRIKLTADVPDDFLLLLNDKPILTWPQDSPPKDEKVNWASYRKSDRTFMFNTGGKNPNALGKFEYGRRPSCLSFLSIEPPATWWIVRKIEFSWVGVGVYLCGDNCTVEDCYFTHCYRGGIFFHGRTDTVRRCSFYRCGNAMHGSGSGVGHIVEDNLIVDCSLRAEDDILPLDIPGCMPEGYPATCFKGNMLSQLFIHNVLSENAGGGWYADCPGVQSGRVIGNAFWDNPGGGIYNEAMVNDSLTQGNVFYRNGIGSSVATRWNLIDNLFFESGIFWNNLDINPMRDSYMLLRRNAFINPPQQGYLTGFASGWGQYAWPEVFRNSIVDRNRIWLAKDGYLVHDGTREYKTLDEVRKEFEVGTQRRSPTPRQGQGHSRVRGQGDGRQRGDLPCPLGQAQGRSPSHARQRPRQLPLARCRSLDRYQPHAVLLLARGGRELRCRPTLGRLRPFRPSRLLAGDVRCRTRERAPRLPLVLRRRGEVPRRPGDQNPLPQGPPA